MKRELSIMTIILMGLSAFAQQKQGHVMRPISKGVGHPTVIGHAQVEVMYALNATDIKDKRLPATGEDVISLHGSPKIFLYAKDLGSLEVCQDSY